MRFYLQETNQFRVYANEPGLHGRGMFTAESAEAAQSYALWARGIPLESWEVHTRSDNVNETGGDLKEGEAGRIDIYLSRYKHHEEIEGTYFSCERVSLIRAAEDADLISNQEQSDDFWAVGQRVIALAAGGAALGGLIAQIPGAIAGSAVGGVLGLAALIMAAKR